MLHFSRSASIIGAPLTLVALLACVTSAGARLASNGVSLNKLSANGVSLNRLSANGVSFGLTSNGIAMDGSALGDLNGVAVEAVVIPEAAIR
jgi:hypothetical protein